MNAFWWWLVENTVVTALLCAITFIACQLLWKRPAVRHALWLIVLAKFVMPPIASWPWPVREMSSMWSQPNRASVFVLGEKLTPTTPGENIPHVDSPKTPLRKLTNVVTSDLALKGALGVWCLGFVTVLTIQIRRLWKCRAILGQGKSAPQHLIAELRILSRALGIAPIRVLVVPEIPTPFVWCLGRSQLVWPESLSKESDLHRSRGLLAHELAHIRRHDQWIVWLELVAGAIWWWNPVCWFVRGRMRESAEMACDAMALSLLPTQRRAYAEMFLEVSSSFSAGVPVPAVGISTGAVLSFERRLSMILSDRVSGKLSRSGVLLAGLFAFAACPSWSLGQSNDDSGKVLFTVVDNRNSQVVFVVGKDPRGNLVVERVGSIELDYKPIEAALKKYGTESKEAESKHGNEAEALMKHRAEEAALMEHQAKEAALMERQAKEGTASNGAGIDASTQETALKAKLHAEADAMSVHATVSDQANLRELEESELKMTRELASLRERLQKLREAEKGAK